MPKRLLFLALHLLAALPDKVTLATNWKAEAEHGGFYPTDRDGDL